MRGPKQPTDHGVVRLSRSGTTAIMVVPKPFLRALRWQIGDHVVLTMDRGRIVVSNAQPHVVALTKVPVEAPPDV